MLTVASDNTGSEIVWEYNSNKPSISCILQNASPDCKIKTANQYTSNIDGS